MNRMRNLVEETDHVNAHGAEAPEDMNGIETTVLQEICGHEGTEAGTIAEMIMRIVAAGAENNSER